MWEKQEGSWLGLKKEKKKEKEKEELDVENTEFVM